MSWVIGIAVLLVMFMMIKSYLKKKKIYKIIISSALLLFFVYSFFTYSGAVRLGITFTTGQPIKAYTYKIKESFSRGNNNKYFSTTKEIPMKNNSMADLECKRYLVIKICSYYGF